MSRELLILALGLAVAELHVIVFRRLWLNKRAYWQQVKADMDARHEKEREALATYRVKLEGYLRGDVPWSEAHNAWVDAMWVCYGKKVSRWNEASAWRGGPRMNTAEVEQAGVEWQRKDGA